MYGARQTGIHSATTVGRQAIFIGHAAYRWVGLRGFSVNAPFPRNDQLHCLNVYIVYASALSVRSAPPLHQSLFSYVDCSGHRCAPLRISSEFQCQREGGALKVTRAQVSAVEDDVFCGLLFKAAYSAYGPGHVRSRAPTTPPPFCNLLRVMSSSQKSDFISNAYHFLAMFGTFFVDSIRAIAGPFECLPVYQLATKDEPEPKTRQTTQSRTDWSAADDLLDATPEETPSSSAAQPPESPEMQDHTPSQPSTSQAVATRQLRPPEVRRPPDRYGDFV
ncbi:hypothetical protein HPB51_013116 [Rhipicephalus microplus]|uniref:Uncharacterized protein n=1 Tax=Rhipicephalus microplus TaxID=6941 RepID=A0A9J6F2G5_RHIMP|nr:hypothetical protein HPB51_013116 [Rhipicephalus microplus]